MIVEYDPQWIEAYSSEADRLRTTLVEAAIAIHHIGSTGVPGLVAKPVIDILVEYASASAIDAREQAMLAAGYEARGEYGIAGRRYFVKSDAGGRRSHHVHCHPAGSPEVVRHVAFRDYLRRNTAKAAEYGALKRTILARGVDSKVDYQNAKEAFVRACEAEALAALQ